MALNTKLDGFTNIAVSLMTQILRVLYHILWGRLSTCSQTDGWMTAYIYSLLTVWVTNDHISSQFYPQLPAFMLKTAHVIAWCLQVSCSPLSLASAVSEQRCPVVCAWQGEEPPLPFDFRVCTSPVTEDTSQNGKGKFIKQESGELCCWTQQLTWSACGKGFVHWGRKNCHNSVILCNS